MTEPTDVQPDPRADAVRAMLALVNEHRTPGDSDLAAAIADVEEAFGLK